MARFLYFEGPTRFNAIRRGLALPKVYLEGPTVPFNLIRRGLSLPKPKMLKGVLDALAVEKLVWREPVGKFVFYHPYTDRLGYWLASAWQRYNENEEKSKRESLDRTFEKLGFSDNPKVVSFLRKRVVPAGTDPREIPKLGI